MNILGIDLAWAAGKGKKGPNETGVVALGRDGRILDASWTRGRVETLRWIDDFASENSLVMVDAPLVVNNLDGQRLCEKQIGQCYGRWFVSANSTNQRSKRLEGVSLRKDLEKGGWVYDDGFGGPHSEGRYVSEVYPYATIVGVDEFDYNQRPIYKRKPKKIRIAEFRSMRSLACTDLIAKLMNFKLQNISVDWSSHPNTKTLAEWRPHSDLTDTEYKHREDLVDAMICAMTGLMWLHCGFERCQVVGETHHGSAASNKKRATIIAPARSNQRYATRSCLKPPM